MINRKNIMIAFLMLLGIVNNLSAEDGRKDQPKFHGTLKLIGNVACTGDTVSFGYRKPYMPSGTIQEVVRVATDKDGNFSFKLPKFDIPIGMTMSVRHRGKFIRVYGVDRYFFEPGDDIKIEIVLGKDFEVNSILFFGDGAEKYNISTECSKIAGSFAECELMDEYLKLANKVNFDSPDNIESKFLQYTELVKNLIKKQDALISNSELDPKMKKMIAYQHSRAYTEWMYRLNVFYNFYQKKNYTEANVILKDIYEKNVERFRSPFPPDDLMSLCSDYLWDQAYRDAWALTHMKSNANTKSVTDVYNTFKSKYSGPLREMLIANLFIAGNGIVMSVDAKMMDSLMIDGNKYITNPIIKDVYHSKLKLLKGKEVFNGIFKDLKGNEVSIVSLRGKVVFIDIWGWGCSACAKFHTMFHKEVYPLLENKKDFVYLSIGSDKKDLYQKSIDRGIYTSADYLNVYMKDLGLEDHPFTKHYQIGSTPFFLLVDRNGKIYTSIISSDSKQVIKVINEALTVPLM